MLTLSLRSCPPGADLKMLAYSYDAVGATDVGSTEWRPTAFGYRIYEHTTIVGGTPERWDELAAAVLSWSIKKRSGFRIVGMSSVQQDASYWLVAAFGPVRIWEPARVVSVVQTESCVGFSYGTLKGHPVSGEEAFILRRSSGCVSLTLRSLTKPGTGAWRALFPLLLVVQRFYRWRYSKTLN